MGELGVGDVDGGCSPEGIAMFVGGVPVTEISAGEDEEGAVEGEGAGLPEEPPAITSGPGMS